MRRDLLAHPVFKESIVTADEYLKHELGFPWSVVEEINRKDSASHLELAEYAQPLSTILQVALVNLLKS